MYRELHFHIKSVKKLFIALITKMAALSRGCKPRINTSEIPVKLSHEIMISSHVKIHVKCYLHTWKDHCCCGYIIKQAFHSKKNHLRKMVRNFLCIKSSKGNFISPRGHVISSMMFTVGVRPVISWRSRSFGIKETEQPTNKGRRK